MKINELSKLTHVNVETIRMYRKKGLLSPAQEDNGYYDYTIDDLQKLLFIRKLRGSNISLDTIRYTYTHPDVDDIIQGFQLEYDELDAQISLLRKRQEILSLTIRHFESFRGAELGIYEEEVADDRYDLLLKEGRPDPVLEEWIANIDMFTLGLKIPPEFFLQPMTGQPIEAQVCIGSYRPIFEKYGFTIPPAAILVPKGHYLSTRIEIEGSHLSAHVLQPMLDYAAAHHYTFTGETTGFIFRVDTTGRSIKYVYRLRARVRENLEGESSSPGQQE